MSPSDRPDSGLGCGDISLVMASYNSEKSLAETLPRNLDLGFGEIVIVDGFSKDGTKALVEDLAERHPGRVSLLERPLKGLANARNQGTAQCSSALVMHAGPDNVIPRETVEAMIAALGDNDLVSCRTFLLESGSYWDRAHNLYKRRFAAGPQEVVGTPYLGRRELFEAYPFDETMLNSDDTELCHRLKRDGKRIFRAEAECHESGFDTLADFWERWSRWGRGDSLFYGKMKDSWTLRRRLKSLMHPFDAELVAPKRYMRSGEYLSCLPFLTMVCAFRYAGWVRHALFGK